MKTDLKVVCEIRDDLVRFEFIRNEKTVTLNDLTRGEQIKAAYTLLNGSRFLEKFINQQ